MVPKERINITIFTDGSCNAKSDRKLGGFGVYIPYGNQEIHLRRGFWNTTTSRMEMKALLAAPGDAPPVEVVELALAIAFFYA